MKRNNIKIIVMIISIFSSICSMDKLAIIKKPNIADNQLLVWDIVLRHGVAVFNYRIINRLGMTSKKLDLILCNTADVRKEYLTALLCLPKNIYWHKHGAMAGRAFHGKCEICASEAHKKKEGYNTGLKMNRFYLHNEYSSIKPLARSVQPPGVYYSEFSGCLPFLQQGFFNENRDFCFYGYDQLRDTVTEYYIAASQKPWELSCSQVWCVTDIANEKSSLLGLKIFLEFPALLNAFLQSNKVRNQRAGEEDDYSTKIYAFEGVQIPQNYRVHKAYFREEAKYSSFDDLPEYVRSAIVKRYKEQQVNNIPEFIISKIERCLIEKEVRKRGKQEILDKIDKNGRKKTKEAYDKERGLYYTQINPCLKISCKFYQQDSASDSLTQNVFQALQPKGRGLGSNTQYSWVKEHKTKGVIKVKSLFPEKYHVLLIVENQMS